MKLSPSLADAGFRGLNLVHRSVRRLSGGRLGGRAMGMTVVELRTVGRRSGHVRSTMLTSPVVEGGHYVLVASKGGADRDPDWYRNLIAEPDVELVVGATSHPMRARRASAEEATNLWPRVEAAYPSYATYRGRTAREIPLVLCEPRRAPTKSELDS